MGWKAKAHELYFEEHRRIFEVAERVLKTRQTVSVYLKSCNEWENEQARRKADSIHRRKRSQRIWDQLNRVTMDDVKRDHVTAVAELSKEKYH